METLCDACARLRPGELLRVPPRLTPCPRCGVIDATPYLPVIELDDAVHLD